MKNSFALICLLLASTSAPSIFAQDVVPVQQPPTIDRFRAKSLESRIIDAEVIFAGTLINRVENGDWVQADLRVDPPLHHSAHGQTFKVTWRRFLSGNELYNAVENQKGVALLDSKRNDRYWLRADKFEDVKSIEQAKSLVLRHKTELSVAGIFGDGMVLQHDTDAAIWGKAKPNAKVLIQGSWNSKVVSTTSDASGNWKTTIRTPQPGGPHRLSIKSDEYNLQFKNILSGEVWICSGQSNMQWKMRGFGVDHFKQDVASAKYPKIRFCAVPQIIGLQPQEKVSTKWSVCTPQSTLSFSCVAYFFGRRLHQELDMPIGLISTNWGGSSAEAWVNQDILKKEFPEFTNTMKGYPALINRSGPLYRTKNRPKGLNQRSPSVLYNTMIRPLIPFSIRGVIWYQGESNVKKPIQYRKLFPALINNWREEWGQADFPFYFVQIAPFSYRNEPLPVALLREAQLKALEVPNTGMAVTMDIGDAGNIHPKQKQPVGERLAKIALAKTYGKTDLVYSGPTYKTFLIEKNQIRLGFKHVGSGLASRDGKPLTHFSIAGKDRVFLPAEATIDGDSIVVKSSQVAKPVAVRFAWGNADQPNLMNQEGLPCSSFRTDDWEIQPKAAKPKKPAKKSASLNRTQASKFEVSLVSTKQAKVAQRKRNDLPNIVFIISDELAYYELSHMGNPKLHTPNIDQMAREGIRFTQALAAAPVCGPLRCCLMTGKHMGHASMRTNGGGTPIRAEEPTIASMLKQRGYATGGFGKWGIGGRGSEGVPEKHGFDVFFGYYDQVHAHSFYTPHLIRNSKEVPLANNQGGRKGETYSHYEIMKEGLKFIRENKDRPFFCYLPITPPHGMYDIPASDPAFALYQDDDWMNDPKVPQDAKNYAGMVSMIDNDLKRVLDLLEELSLDDNTIVFFTGDNGGQDRFVDDQHPRGFFGPNVNPKTGIEFRGQKRSLYEGALRIPFLVRWPGKIQPNQVSDHLFYQVDMMATLAELTKSPMPVKSDGLSILPTLLGEQVVGHAQEEHEFLYWEYLKQTAVRKGNWKAVRTKPNNDWELYNLATDISEAKNIAREHPEIVKELAHIAKQAHIPAKPGKFLRNDLQRRDRIARNGVPEPLEETQN